MYGLTLEARRVNFASMLRRRRRGVSGHLQGQEAVPHLLSMVMAKERVLIVVHKVVTLGDVVLDVAVAVEEHLRSNSIRWRATKSKEK